MLTLQDAAYPARLRNITDPPAVLYVKGRLPAVDTEAVAAVVGTRKCTPYGVKLARDIANKIEATMSYPGVIKVNVIRETRAVEYAK